MNKKRVVIISGILLVFLGNIAVYLWQGKNPPDWEENKDLYQSFQNTQLIYEDSVYGVVNSVNISRGNALCIVNDSVKINLWGENKSQSPINVVDVVEAGDSIIKMANTELYKVKHNGQTYIYHITKILQ